MSGHWFRRQRRRASRRGRTCICAIASGHLLAWALVRTDNTATDLKNAVLERLEGDDQHAGMLKKDMVRIYGPLGQA